MWSVNDAQISKRTYCSAQSEIKSSGMLNARTIRLLESLFEHSVFSDIFVQYVLLYETQRVLLSAPLVCLDLRCFSAKHSFSQF